MEIGSDLQRLRAQQLRAEAAKTPAAENARIDQAGSQPNSSPAEDLQSTPAANDSRSFQDVFVERQRLESVQVQDFYRSFEQGTHYQRFENTAVNQDTQLRDAFRPQDPAQKPLDLAVPKTPTISDAEFNLASNRDTEHRIAGHQQINWNGTETTFQHQQQQQQTSAHRFDRAADVSATEKTNPPSFSVGQMFAANAHQIVSYC